MTIEKYNEMISESKPFFEYSEATVIAYEKYALSMLEEVNETLERHAGILEMIGGNSVDMLENNHQNHVDFMTSVFKYKQNELLVKTLPWVYKAYASKGFQLRYFEVELETWIKVLKSRDDLKLNPLIRIYELMASWHEINAEISMEEALNLFTTDQIWTDFHQNVMTGLLLGNHKGVLDVLLKNYSLPGEEGKIYMDILQPVLYRIGKHWEEGRVSVAQEHIAASTVSRIMAHLHIMNESDIVMKGDVIVSTGANEFHQIGARMVADLLENAGWNVRFLGADLPAGSLGDMLDQINPEIVALSVTMPFNVTKVIETVKYIKSKDRWENIKLMVGGIAINNDPTLHHIIGADAYPSNALESVEIAEQWHNQKNK